MNFSTIYDFIITSDTIWSKKIEDDNLFKTLKKFDNNKLLMNIVN